VAASAYKLDLPEGNRLIHPVFHISQLKKFTPDYKPVYSELPVQVDFSKEVLAVGQEGEHDHPTGIVKWMRLPDSASTWEDWNVLVE
jgi:hypothetical protein